MRFGLFDCTKLEIPSPRLVWTSVCGQHIVQLNKGDARSGVPCLGGRVGFCCYYCNIFLLFFFTKEIRIQENPYV